MRRAYLNSLYIAQSIAQKEHEVHLSQWFDIADAPTENHENLVFAVKGHNGVWVVKRCRWAASTSSAVGWTYSLPPTHFAFCPASKRQ